MFTFIVFCAGASGSGKTTFSAMLEKELNDKGISTLLIPMDNYYKARELNTPELSNFDVPEAFDVNRLCEDIRKINQNIAVELPIFSFAVKNRTEKTIPIKPGSYKIVILEGIHAFLGNSCDLPEEQTYFVYVETSSYLKILERRIKRDIPPANEGGRDTTEELTRERELTCGVRDAFFQYIAPEKSKADKIISNDKQEDLSKAVSEVFDEIMTKLKLTLPKPNYSVAELKRLDFWRPAQKTREIEIDIVKAEHSVSDLVSKFNG